MTDRTAEHYERVAKSYNEHWNYDPDHVRRLSRAMIDSLRLTRSDTIIDVGCGTGLYARAILEEVEPARPILCVDPTPAMLDQLPVSRGLQPLLAGAEDLASGHVAIPAAAPVDAIILKESVHHIASRKETLAGLADLLSGHGRILLVMLPTTIQHPLFHAAHERFEQLQPDPADVEDMLATAGLRTSISYRTFHVALDRERYVRMLQSRYMSVLGDFSEAELNEGIEQFRRAYTDPVVRFDDHFAFVKGWVPPERAG